MMRDWDSLFPQPEEGKYNLVDGFSYLVGEDRVTCRENSAGLDSEVHSQKTKGSNC